MMDRDLLLYFWPIYPQIYLEKELYYFNLPAGPNVQHDTQQLEDHCNGVKNVDSSRKQSGEEVKKMTKEVNKMFSHK